jgi:drug/metabolite transporter (DMT)-like permease
MAAYSALTGLALTSLPPGRASVLAFSTPIWVVPLAAWWLRERHSRRALLGVGLGILGVVTIASPALRVGRAEHVLAYAMLLGAAAAWALSIVMVRAHRFSTSALALAPWQMFVAGCALAPVALLVEGTPRPPALSGVLSLMYVGPIATAFAYWAVVEVGRRTRASTMSMALLLAPCLGILISAVTLGEVIGPSLVCGVGLVGVGIYLANRSSPPRPSTQASGTTVLK